VLTELDRNLWTAVAPLSLMGMHIGARMTVVRLENGGLWLHSPIKAEDDLKAAVAKLGPVEFLVAPNCFHHFFVGGWKRAFPKAKLLAAPGLAEKRPKLAIDGTLGDAPDPAWGDAFDQTLFEGAPKLNEVVFLHRPSRTLIATDLIFNLTSFPNWTTRFFATMFGTRRGPAVSRLFKMVTRDKAAARRSLDRILSWEFDRIVMAHGEPIESGGSELLRDRCRWLG